MLPSTPLESEQPGQGFTTLMGITATAQALGGFVGPLVTGVLSSTSASCGFLVLAAVAVVAALVYLLGVPETAARGTVIGRARATLLR